MIEWLAENWLAIVIPLLAFLATYIVGLWLRRLVGNLLERWKARTSWEGSEIVARAVLRPFLLWVVLLGIAIAIQVSVLSPGLKSISGKSIGSLFVLSFGWVIITLGERLLKLYLGGMKVPQTTITLVVNIVRITFVVIAC